MSNMRTFLTWGGPTAICTLVTVFVVGSLTDSDWPVYVAVFLAVLVGTLITKRLCARRTTPSK
jgi:uncharacterized integral membrane protein